MEEETIEINEEKENEEIEEPMRLEKEHSILMMKKLRQNKLSVYTTEDYSAEAEYRYGP